MEAEVRHAGRDRSRADDQILMAGKVQLIHQRPHARGIDSPSGRNQTGAEFDDEAHD